MNYQAMHHELCRVRDEIGYQIEPFQRAGMLDSPVKRCLEDAYDATQRAIYECRKRFPEPGTAEGQS